MEEQTKRTRLMLMRDGGRRIHLPSGPQLNHRVIDLIEFANQHCDPNEHVVVTVEIRTK